MVAAFSLSPRYPPPCEHEIIQMSSGSFAVNNNTCECSHIFGEHPSEPELSWDMD